MVKRIHRANPDVAEQPALIAPVDLPLPARNHLEPAMQTDKPIVVVLAKIGRDPRAGLGTYVFTR